tara:strand:+ start:755 stop:1072 length:318 start_codon:yes stop_codon:yes gene_type:complete
MLKVDKKWTFDSALNKNKDGEDYKILKFKRVFGGKEKNETHINVWRRVKDDLGRIYLWNIVTMETKWPETQLYENITLSNQRFSYCDIESLHNNKIFIEKRIQNV